MTNFFIGFKIHNNSGVFAVFTNGYEECEGQCRDAEPLLSAKSLKGLMKLVEDDMLGDLADGEISTQLPKICQACKGVSLRGLDSSEAEYVQEFFSKIKKQEALEMLGNEE